MTVNPRDHLALALDVDDADYAVELVDRFSGSVDIFKIGMELHTVSGNRLVDAIHARGKKVFLDLKFHDIPTTVARAGMAAARLGIHMFNVHASGGYDMMKRCRDEVIGLCLKENIPRPKIVAVTVLTSMSQDVLKHELGIQHSLQTQVRHLAGLSLKAGLDGVVSSAQEAAKVRSHCGSGFMIVTPGIRPTWAAHDDQHRLMTPRKALQEGADLLVIGRAVLNHDDPMAAIDLIQREIAEAV